MDSANKPINTLLFSATVILAIAVVVTNNFIPVFEQIFEKFDTDLPVVTLFVLNSYDFWWLLPVITGVVLVMSLQKKPRTSVFSQRVSTNIAILSIFVSMLLVILSVVAVYLPVM